MAARLAVRVLEIVHHPVVVTVEGVIAPEGRRVLPMLKAEVPLPDGVRLESVRAEHFRQHGLVQVQPIVRTRPLAE